MAANASTKPTEERNDAVRSGMELIYLGQEGLRYAADSRLQNLGIGRAHYRALYVIERWPGATTNDIKHRLSVTSQAIARVLSDLLRLELVVQHSDASDRRLRRHTLTKSGATVHSEIYGMQAKILTAAYERCGPEARDGFIAILTELTNELPAGERRIEGRYRR